MLKYIQAQEYAEGVIQYKLINLLKGVKHPAGIMCKN